MEKHEKNRQQKAQKLIREFERSFRNIDLTVHDLQSGEYKGKGSNVNWCARKLEDKLKSLGIDSDRCFLTIIDADAQLLQLYIAEMEDHIKENWQRRFEFVYGPFNIFAKNNQRVPGLTRVIDHLIGSLQTANIVNLTGFGLTVSNYSVSYNSAKIIDFWDTNKELITEDFHFMEKACWKTEEKIKTIPIFVPVNYMNIQTGKGYWEDIKARFWQSERHNRSCNEIGYCLRMFFNQKFNWKTFRMFVLVLETLVLQTFYPLIMLASIFQNHILTAQQLGITILISRAIRTVKSFYQD